MGGNLTSWRTIQASVRGEAHERLELPNQDALATRLLDWAGQSVLLLVISDGAGSAEYSQEGSRLVSLATLDWLTRRFQTSAASEPALHEDDGARLLRVLRMELEKRALWLGVTTRELACTLSVAVLAADWAWYLQVGDGAIVTGQGVEWQVVFWPDNGEYANQTYFIGDVPEDHLHVCLRLHAPGRVALFTDGLHTLTLQLGARQPHAPFFEPMFRTLEGQPSWTEVEPQRLSAALADFLDSPAVNARTTDDKTLILSSRETPGAEGR